MLVVEDNVTNQAVARGMLEKFGLSIDVAANGEEAIQALRQLPYDLVLMDCQMPVLDGYQATRMIRASESGVNAHDIPVLAMTANAMQGDYERCIQAGMNDHIAKPVDPAKLRRALQRWLPQYCQETGSAPERDAAEADDDALSPQLAGGPLFDHAALRARLLDDDDLVREIVAAFREDAEDQLQSLGEAVAAGDATQAGLLAHKIKGASSNVGGMRLSALARELELKGKAGDLQAVRLLLPSLERQFRELQTAMREICP